MKYNSKTIDKALRGFYFSSAKYLVSNIYAFDKDYGETDLLIVRSGNEYIYDIEIKISRADFRADFKKEAKHSILKTGEYLRKTKYRRKKITKLTKTTNIPNRFYYAVPEGLITKEEVPSYAGLIYIGENGEVKKIKEAKLLHKKRLDVEKLLCRKLYFYWLNAEEKLERVKNKLKACERLKK